MIISAIIIIKRRKKRLQLKIKAIKIVIVNLSAKPNSVEKKLRAVLDALGH